MGFMDNMKNKAQEFTQGHEEQVDQGLDKAGDAAKEKFGHEEQVDQASEKAKDFLGGEGGGQEGQ